MPRKYKGLGVGGFCLPEKSIHDYVTYGDLQRELRRLRVAIMRLAARSHDIGDEDARIIMDCLKEPGERDVGGCDDRRDDGTN